MDYPIFFQLPYEIRCQDTFARVLVSGRALLTEEDGEWWCHGVYPGAITALGRSPHLAFIQFKVALDGVLQDFAQEAQSCEALKLRVRDFVTTSDESESVRWQEARAAIRAGQAVDWTLEKVRRVVDDWPIQAVVEDIGQIEERSAAEIAIAQDRVA